MKIPKERDVVMLNFVNGCVDEGNVPETNVTSVSSIERISAGQIRVNYYRKRRDEKLVVACLVWDREEWLEMWNLWEINREAIGRALHAMPTHEDKVREMH